MANMTKDELAKSLELYAVTDRAWVGERTLTACVEEAIKGGITFLQLREKEAPRAEIELRARVLLPLAREARIPFVIDDDVELAKIVGADGVHVGQSDMACEKARKTLGDDAIIGVSAGTVEEALAAQAAGADYIGVGGIYPTSTKEDAQVIGVDGLRKICEAVDIPVVAIGGVNAENLATLKGSGADGVALVSAIFAADDIEAATRKLRKIADETFGDGEDTTASAPANE
ncbi:thiamine phosphate synthase [Adlercreutzia agrestimuris]|uniref:thiamine phosphate synthase n=1 Tax=Adlercreutzia agrestimuris TaxID=2941324 RepID=UPI00203E5EEE|nr:thiamine phosphate synthase [Adlercreutzia agrestimuris]